MPFDTIHLALAACMFLGALLYSTVGHGGASSYIALMALFSVPVATMRPTALVLNLIVATLGSIRYARAGLFRWRTLWPFLVGAFPAAFVGGMIEIAPELYRPSIGVILLFAALRMLWPIEMKSEREWHDPPIWLAILAGIGLGLLAGLTGTGGGIFLSPLLLFLAWSAPKPASGVVAVFILANSAAGLAGNFASVGALPPELPLYAVAVLAGGLIGTTLGIKLPQKWILRALGAVLLVASAKLFGVY